MKKINETQRRALEWLAKGRSLRGHTHGRTTNWLKLNRLIEDSDTITAAGLAAISKPNEGAAP